MPCSFLLNVSFPPIYSVLFIFGDSLTPALMIYLSYCLIYILISNYSVQRSPLCRFGSEDGILHSCHIHFERFVSGHQLCDLAYRCILFYFNVLRRYVDAGCGVCLLWVVVEEENGMGIMGDLLCLLVDIAVL